MAEIRSLFQLEIYPLRLELAALIVCIYIRSRCEYYTTSILWKQVSSKNSSNYLWKWHWLRREYEPFKTSIASHSFSATSFSITRSYSKLRLLSMMTIPSHVWIVLTNEKNIYAILQYTEDTIEEKRDWTFEARFKKNRMSDVGSE